MQGCNQLSCEGGMHCCVNINYYPGFYCKIASQCYQQPIWQMIVIPSLLFLFTLSLILLVFCKLRNKLPNKRSAISYAYQQVRVRPQPFHMKHRTFTTVPQTPNNVIIINSPVSPISPYQNNMNIVSQISSVPQSGTPSNMMI